MYVCVEYIHNLRTWLLLALTVQMHTRCEAAFTSYWYVDVANYLPAWRMKEKMGETRALQTECLCPSKMYMLKSVFQYDGVWEVIRS